MVRTLAFLCISVHLVMMQSIYAPASGIEPEIQTNLAANIETACGTSVESPTGCTVTPSSPQTIAGGTTITWTVVTSFGSGCSPGGGCGNCPGHPFPVQIGYSESVIGQTITVIRTCRYPLNASPITFPCTTCNGGRCADVFVTPNRSPIRWRAPKPRDCCNGGVRG